MGVVVVDLRGKDSLSPILDKVRQKAQQLQAAFDKTSTRIQEGFGKLKKSFTNLSSQASSLQSVLVGVGAGAAVKGFAQAGIEADRTAKRLKLLGDEYGETSRLQEIAANAADKFSLGQTDAASAVADLFGRLRPMGVSLEEIETVFSGVNVAAKQMNLTTADTEGVMLQLSQALGSGKLQGDEFRSIMERLPKIGQAVAKSMGKSVNELKDLSSQGKITTQEIVKALRSVAKEEFPTPDAAIQFNKAMKDLSTAIGQKLLPVLTPAIKLITSIVNGFLSLPEPVQAAAIGFTAVAGAFAVIGPLLPIIAAGLAAIVAVVTGPVGIVAAISGAVAAFFAMKGATDETKKPVDEVNKKIDQTKIAVDAATEAKKRFIEKTKESLEFLTQEKAQVEAQKSAYQNTINVTNARLNAEKAINDLQGQILDRAYEQASSATQRLNIAKQIFHNEVNGAKLAYQQTLNSIEAERGKLELKRQGAVIDAQILKARGAILVAETEGIDKKREAQRQADKALDAQMQAVRLIDGQIKAQAQVGEHQKTAAKAQLEAKIMTAEQNVKQKLVSEEIGMSNTNANKLVTSLGNSVRDTGNLATGTGQVAENARRSAHMFIQVSNQASNAANQINRAATAQRNLNAARAQSSSSSNSGSTETAAAGAYWSGGFQAFAKGGMVKGPTLGLIGEGGEPEYIIPQSKAAGFAANFLSGKRGTSAIPGFADGGVVAPSSASVNIQTGPVTQMGGQNYVTMQDMSQAVQAGVEQTLQFLMSDGTVRAGVGLD
mgnify:FL=1